MCFLHTVLILYVRDFFFCVCVSFRVTGGELFEDIVAREYYSEADARSAYLYVWNYWLNVAWNPFSLLWAKTAYSSYCAILSSNSIQVFKFQYTAINKYFCCIVYNIHTQKYISSSLGSGRNSISAPYCAAFDMPFVPDNFSFLFRFYLCSLILTQPVF